MEILIGQHATAITALENSLKADGAIGQRVGALEVASQSHGGIYHRYP